MGFSRQECWSKLPFPSPRDLPDPWIKPLSPALAGGFFSTEPLGKCSVATGNYILVSFCSYVIVSEFVSFRTIFLSVKLASSKFATVYENNHLLIN